MSILEQYKKQLAEDRKFENLDFPENTTLSDNQHEEYAKKLKELRNSPNDMENVYHKKMAEMVKLSEKELETTENIQSENIDHVIVKHAYCKECGEELISNAPPMFNPFTFERICKHTCTKCGKVYNLEFAYPRLAFINNKGEEIPAFTR